jgi:hypothetical protein
VGDLGQGSPLTTDGDHRVPGGDHGEIPGLADARGDRVADVAVRVRAREGGKDAEHGAAGLGCPLGRGLHHPGQPAADQHRPGLGDAPPNGLGVAEDLRIFFGRPWPDHRDLSRASHALSLSAWELFAGDGLLPSTGATLAGPTYEEWLAKQS